MEIILLATLSAAGFLILSSKIMGFMRVLKYQRLVDIVATLGIPFLFFGSFAGMATAIITGLIVSIFLWIVASLLDIGRT